MEQSTEASFRNSTRICSLKCTSLNYLMTATFWQMSLTSSCISWTRTTTIVRFDEFVVFWKDPKISASVAKRHQQALERRSKHAAAKIQKSMDMNALFADFLNSQDLDEKRNVLQKLFSKLDKDKNGTMELKEFNSFLRQLTRTFSMEPMKNDDVCDFFNELDSDANGVISFDEFVDWFCDALSTLKTQQQ